MQEKVLPRIFDFIDQHFDEHLAATQDYLRQPSISAMSLGIQECAEMTANILRCLGAKVEIIPLEGGHPVVYGHLASKSSNRTLIVYSMYDVQPVDPLDEWQSPPFEARIVGDRIIARGAYNSKGPLMAFINAVQSIIKVSNDIPCNIIFVIEGEEEIGSINLPQFIEKHTNELRSAEAIYYHLPTEFIKGNPQILLGYKGLAYFELEVKTLPTDTHSMTAPVVNNPIWRMIWALDSIRGVDDQITINEFFKNVRLPTDEDEKLLRDLLDIYGSNALRTMYGITRFREGLHGIDFVREWIFSPTINIDGFVAGYTGPGMKTIVPSSAMCKVDIRLVPDMTVQEVIEKVRSHLDLHGYEDIEIRFISGYNPTRTSIEEPIVQAAIHAIQVMGVQPKIVPMLPGSAPQVMFGEPPLNLPFVVSGLGHGWLMHAPNEYFETEGLRSCEKSAAAFLLMFASSSTQD